MDFLNTAYRQLSDLFRSMTPAARITTALLLVAVVSSLLYLFRYQADRSDEFLFGGLVATQSEIVAMEAALGKHGLSNYDILGNKLRVPRLQRDAYLAALAEENALPQNADSAWLHMFETESPFDSRDTRERKAEFAKEKKLAYLISKMPGIEVATVTINEEPAAAFGARKTRQALVAVKPLGGKRLDEDQVRTIRGTVSGAGIPEESVTVSDLNGGIYPGVGKNNGVSEFHNIYAAYQRQFSNEYKQKILNHLASYPGVRVEVHVELDKNLQNQKSSLKYGEKQIPTQLTTVSKESSANTGGSGARPGAVPNTGVAPNTAQVAAATSESTLNETREDQKNVFDTTQETTQTAPLTPTYVSASIGIPRSYLVNVWHQRNPAKPGEEPKTPPTSQLDAIETEKKKEIEEAVVMLLPRKPLGDDMWAPVKVVAFDDTPMAMPEPPSLATNAFHWFAANWQTVGMFGLAAFGVVFLRGMVRSAQAFVPPPVEDRNEKSSQGTAEDEATATVSKEAAESAASTLKRKFQSTGRSLREELTELVREDPDAAANVLKLWINDAA